LWPEREGWKQKTKRGIAPKKGAAPQKKGAAPKRRPTLLNFPS